MCVGIAVDSLLHSQPAMTGTVFLHDVASQLVKDEFSSSFRYTAFGSCNTSHAYDVSERLVFLRALHHSHGILF